MFIIDLDGQAEPVTRRRGENPTFVICLVGQHSVGKTCLSERYCQGSTSLNEAPTIGAAFMVQVLEVDGTLIRFEIWDTAGQEKYAALAPMYFRSANGTLLVYDTTNAESFEAMKKWDSLISDLVPNMTKLIVGSKMDLTERREVLEEDVQAYSDSKGIPHCLVSAKTGEGVNAAFTHLGSLLLNRTTVQ